MRLQPVRAALLIVIAFLTGCSAGASGPEGGIGGSKSAVTNPSGSLPAVTASDLAPSQLAAPTVPEPTKPTPCSVDDLTIWTAQVLPGVSTIDALIRIRNDGDDRCDADIGRSPNLDPAIEFDVWLERGSTADLVVGQMDDDCVDPSLVPVVDVAISEEVAAVPTMVLTCSWWLTAFYPNDPPRDACEPELLDLAVASDAFLVRNGSVQPCVLAGIVGADGAAVMSERTPGPEIHQLLPGDVVAFGRRSSASCDGSAGRVELHGNEASALVFEDVPCDLVVEPGGGRPWFGSLGAGLDSGDDLDVTALIASSNPFEDAP